MNKYFEERLIKVKSEYETLVHRPNRKKLSSGNGIVERYEFPVLTAGHVPYSWKYDLNPATNPSLLERFGINAVFNAGAIRFKGKYLLVARVEGVDRKSFFAIAESTNGIDNFEFRQYPISLPSNGSEDVNVYDMRLVAHQDGWIYGIFCTEHLDPNAPPGNQSAAIAQCGIIRTKDFDSWERLPNLTTSSPQQRNVVLHSEFVNGMYAFFTRPQDDFIFTGRGGGISFGVCPDITNPVIMEETLMAAKVYHTVYETKNGLGPAPLKTKKGWLHMAHGVRNTAAGLRYVLYLFLTELNDVSRIIAQPAGYFMAPEDEERVGDVSNVLFCNGWIEGPDGQVYIYYASSDARMHIAVSSIDRLLDYVLNTAPDTFTSAGSVRNLLRIIDANADVKSDREIIGSHEHSNCSAS